MAGYALGILGLGALCGAWVLVQHFCARYDPEAPGVERCSTCGSARSCKSGAGHGHHHH